jgi:hypothetical protein
MNCLHFGGRTFYSRSLSPKKYGFAALRKTSAGERHSKKTSLLQRPSLPYEFSSTRALAHAPLTHQTHCTPAHNSALFTFLLARNARECTPTRSVCLCAIWVCIHSSSKFSMAPGSPTSAECPWSSCRAETGLGARYVFYARPVGYELMLKGRLNLP